MTGLQALQILQKPVFGDQQCIEARDVLRIVAELHSKKADSLKNLMKKDLTATGQDLNPQEFFDKDTQKRLVQSFFLYSQFGYADESRS